MLKCGLTGATGVLGSAIRRELNYKFIFFRGRIESKKDVQKWVKNNKFDFIIHLAAIVPTNIVNKDFYMAKKINYSGTKNLIDSIVKYKPDLKWFFFSSTSHVYETQNKLSFINERSKPNPSSKYGLIKLQAEYYIINKLKKSKIIYCIGRIFSFSGIDQRVPFLIPSLILRVKKEKNKIIFFKDLNHYRDFLSLESICMAIDILRKNLAKGVYNICSGKALLLKNLAKFIAKKYNKKCKFYKSRKTFLIGSNNKLRRIGFVNKENYYDNLDYIIKNK